MEKKCYQTITPPLGLLNPDQIKQLEKAIHDGNLISPALTSDYLPIIYHYWCFQNERPIIDITPEGEPFRLYPDYGSAWKWLSKKGPEIFKERSMRYFKECASGYLSASA